MRSLVTTALRVRALLGSDRSWRWVLLLALALVVTAFEVIGAGMVFLLLGLVSRPQEGVELPLVGDLASYFPSASSQELIVGVALLTGAFFVLRFFLIAGRAYIQHRLIHNAGASLAGELLRGYLAMPYVLHTQRSSAELIRNAYDATQEMVIRALRPLVDIGAELILVIGLAAVLLVTSTQATLLALAVLGPTVLIMQRVIQPRLKQLGRDAQTSKAASIEAVQQSLAGVRDIKLLGRETEFARAHTVQRFSLARALYLSNTFKELPRTMIETALVLTIVGVLLVAALGGEAIQSSLPTLGLFAYAGLRMQPSLQKIVAGTNELRFTSAVLDDLIADRQAARVWLRDQVSADNADTGACFEQALEARAVTFSYAGGEGSPALDRIELNIAAGEFVGICGPTGGGKSTLVDLLVGLLQPTSGAITVDGRPLGTRPTWWWQQLGVVSQQVFLIDDTLRANVVFGQAPEDVDPERLSRCLRRAQLDQVVADLPNGLDTVVGERGIRLSGGQRQRVAIARALYREPAVLVFDEGTSALDSATEAELVTALDEVKEGRTLIAVAHRISTLRDADRILVVANGAIAEVGTYDELLARSPLFRSLAG